MKNQSIHKQLILFFLMTISLSLFVACIGNEKVTITVPEGAQVGDLALEPCTYEAKQVKYAAECGTLIVPENRMNPDSRLIALPLIRVKATGSHSGDPIFYLKGGPGQSNLDFKYLEGLVEQHDFVQVGYRGIDGSSVLDCPETVEALKSADDLLSDSALNNFSSSISSCAERLQGEGVDITGYTLPERINDMEAARVALGYDQINLLSSSVGTRTSLIYAQTYPESISRSVMIAVNPPGHFLWKAETIDEQIAYYAELCAQDTDCSARTDDFAQTMRDVSHSMPERWLLIPIKPGAVKLATFFGMFNTSTDPLSAPMIIDAWLSAAEGDPSGLAFLSVMADMVFPSSFVWGETSATGGIDKAIGLDYLSEGNLEETIMGTPGSTWMFGGMSGWPTNTISEPYNHIQPSDVETLLIGGTVDFSTPPQFARDELLPYLSNGQQIILSEFGHTDDIFGLQPEATNHLITTYYDSGITDDTLFTHQPIDFKVSRGLPTLAKVAVVLMITIPLGLIIFIGFIVLKVRKYP